MPAINDYADSLCINFHKVRIKLFFASTTAQGSIQWGLVNFDCSGFWVRDRKDLTEALDITPPFLRSTEGDAGSCLFLFPGPELDDEPLLGTVIDYRNWGLALGRRFRSSKVWFALRSFGVEGYQAHIRKVNLRSHIPKTFSLHAPATVH